MVSVLAAMLAFAAGGPAHAQAWRLVARAGEPAPGLDDPADELAGAVISELELLPRVAADGTVAFQASLVKDVQPRGHALYRHRDAGDGPELLLRGEIRAAFLGDGGDFLAAERRGDPGTTLCGPAPLEFLWLFPADGGERLVASHASPPGATGPTVRATGLDGCDRGAFCGLSAWNRRPVLAADGTVAFHADVWSGQCSPVSSGLWSADASGWYEPVALDGDPAEGVPGGVVRDATWSSRAFNRSGQLAFRATLEDGSSALYRFDPEAGIELLVPSGAPAPLAGGATFAFLHLPALDGQGVPAFFARVEPATPENPYPPHELWGPDGLGGVRRLAAAGEPVPGGPPGAVFDPAVQLFGVLADAPLVNAAGGVAARLDVDVGSAEPVSGLFGPGEDGAFTLRLFPGDEVPGIPEASLRWAGPIALDDDGEILVRVALDGVDAERDAAWYLLSPNGDMRLLLREGDRVPIGPGRSLPVPESAQVYGDADLERFALFVPSGGHGKSAILIRVPAPSSSPAAACAAGALGALALRRRRRSAR